VEKYFEYRTRNTEYRIDARAKGVLVQRGKTEKIEIRNLKLWDLPLSFGVPCSVFGVP
jgi:hypothetical protein